MIREIRSGLKFSRKFRCLCDRKRLLFDTMCGRVFFCLVRHREPVAQLVTLDALSWEINSKLFLHPSPSSNGLTKLDVSKLIFPWILVGKVPALGSDALPLFEDQPGPRKSFPSRDWPFLTIADMPFPFLSDFSLLSFGVSQRLEPSQNVQGYNLTTGAITISLPTFAKRGRYCQMQYPCFHQPSQPEQTY
jgi:hypothetical protein